jgi:hypothetical protein
VGEEEGELGKQIAAGSGVIREERRILDGLLDIFALQIRIIPQNLVVRHSPSQQLENDRHWNAHAANAGSASHDAGIEGDAVENHE